MQLNIQCSQCGSDLEGNNLSVDINIIPCLECRTLRDRVIQKIINESIKDKIDNGNMDIATINTIIQESVETASELDFDEMNVYDDTHEEIETEY